MTICMLAESKWERAAVRTSSAVKGQIVEIESGELSGEAVESGDAEGEDAGEIGLSVGEFVGTDGECADAVELVENFGEGGGDDFVAHGGVDGEVAVAAEGVDAAARAVGVALLLADVGDEAGMEGAAVDGIGEGEAEPVGMLAGDGEIAGDDLGLDGAGSVDQENVAAEMGGERGLVGLLDGAAGPAVEGAIELLDEAGGSEIADGEEESVGGRKMSEVEGGEQVPGDGLDLRLGGGDDGVGMLAEEHAAKALGGEKRGRGALEADGFDGVAALALEGADGKGGIAGEVGDEGDELRGEFGEAAGGDPARVRARACAEVGAEAAELLVDGMLVASVRAGAEERGGETGDAGLGESDGGGAAADDELEGKFGDGVAFDHVDGNAAGETGGGPRGPDDGALGSEWGSERGNGSDGFCGHGGAPQSAAFCAAWAAGRRKTMERFSGRRTRWEAARTSPGVTRRKPSSAELTRLGSPSKSVKQAR